MFEDRYAGVSKMSAHIVREAIWRVPWMALRGAVRTARAVSQRGIAHEPHHGRRHHPAGRDRLRQLPPSRPERFQRSDFIAAGLVFFITLGVYIATLAPNVTLEDSGELITAAAKFGVGHPPGYPLWTMSGFLLSHLLPFGNLAWRINLLCALFGAASNAVLTLLVCHSGRWLVATLDGRRRARRPVRPFVFYAGHARRPRHRLQRRDVEPGGHLRRARHAQRAFREPGPALLLSLDARAAKNAPAGLPFSSSPSA